jgi:hypothetical protein
MAAALGQLIHKEYGVVRQRHFARHRPVAPADQPRIGDGVMRGAEGPGRDQCRAVAREASDAVDAGGPNGLRQDHGWQDGGELVDRHHGEDPMLLRKRCIGVGSPPSWARRKPHGTNSRAARCTMRIWLAQKRSEGLQQLCIHLER